MMDQQNFGMSRRDRDELAKLTRRREKVAKSDARERAAKLRADGEAQLATIFRADDERWAAAVEVAEKAVADANVIINHHCDEAGIPQGFRPLLASYFVGRRENGTASRRAELRRVLDTRITALEKQAHAEIERRSLTVQTALLAGGLGSDEARAFLESMPTAEDLMPGLAVTDFPEVAQLMGKIPAESEMDSAP